MRRFFLIVLFSLSSLLSSFGEEKPPANVDPSVWRNPDEPVEVRVQALMGQLTSKEKVSLLYWLAPAIDRLGIPAYDHGNEGLHGLVRPGKNTSFPQAIGLGATFDPDLIQEMASAVSDEARARWNDSKGQHLGLYSDVLTLWAPVVNMARDPRWGRTQETFGEDPWLTSRLGVAFVHGLQGDDRHYLKVIATLKHFAGNNQEAGRFGKNIVCDERYLYDYELFPFRAGITEGKAESIMAAYTAINGVPSAANQWLLTDVLRRQWGFQGYVVSDCGAVSHVVDSFHYSRSPEAAIAACLNAGLDMEGGYFATYPDVVNNYLPDALAQGLVKQEVVDAALEKVLTGRFKLGMYDPPERLPYSKIPMSVIGSAEHIALARKLADESIVLLKNHPIEGKPLLPIDSALVRKIVVVGPNAAVDNLGDYSGTPTESISPLAGLQARVRAAGISVTAFPWQTGKMEAIPANAFVSDLDAISGLTGDYYATGDFSGTPSTRVDKQLNFNWAHIEPDPLASAPEFSVRWKGSLRTEAPGAYIFSCDADGAIRLSIDGKVVINRWGEMSAKRRTVTWKTDALAPGDHPFLLEYHHQGGDTGLVLQWQTPIKQDYFEPIKSADLVVAFMGISKDDECEGKDRSTLHLPVEQEAFIKRIVGLNPHTIVVQESGSPIAAPSVYTQVPAVVQAWYPGQEGGNAIADILFGDVGPSGRLPLTFYADDAQLRPMEEYDLTKGRTYMYLQGKPAYAFGHGLSYTTFQYANLQLSRTTVDDHQRITATIDVTNVGNRDGDEVVQAYVHAEKASVAMPIRQLWAFQRVSIPKGKTKSVKLELDPSRFGFWDDQKHAEIIEPGKFDVQVGGASDDIRASQTFDIMK